MGSMGDECMCVSVGRTSKSYMRSTSSYRFASSSSDVFLRLLSDMNKKSVAAQETHRWPFPIVSAPGAWACHHRARKVPRTIKTCSPLPPLEAFLTRDISYVLQLHLLQTIVSMCFVRRTGGESSTCIGQSTQEVRLGPRFICSPGPSQCTVLSIMYLLKRGHHG
jgi:hypothetical protein